MLVMGGGGEPTGANTIFDGSLKTISDRVKGSDWKYQMSFNGGHSGTEEILKSHFPAPESPPTKFTEDAFNNLIQNYKAKILMGQLKPGSQLMIIIDSHGAMKIKGEDTHKIALSGKSGTDDLLNLTGASLVSLDNLQSLAKLASESGVKLAVVDLSCHSGNTQALKAIAPNACIITSTSGQHFGYTGPQSFSENFLKGLKKGETLESIFLKARASSTTADYPMISTEENEKIMAQVYAGITPYLYYYKPKEDKLSDYIMSSSEDCITCTREQQFDKLISEISKLQANAVGRSGAYDGEKLKKLLAQYKSQQDALIIAIKNLKPNIPNKKEFFTTPVTYRGKKLDPIELEYSWQDIIKMNVDSAIDKFIIRAAKSTKPLDKAESLAIADTYKKIKIKKQEIINQYPALNTYNAEAEKVLKKVQNNRLVVESIAIEEKKFYDELYRHHQSLNTNEPCRRFVY